jgi:hypothetical protein
MNRPKLMIFIKTIQTIKIYSIYWYQLFCYELNLKIRYNFGYPSWLSGNVKLIQKSDLPTTL